MTRRAHCRLALIALLGAVTACESESVLPGPEQPGETGEIAIDATSSTDFAYLDLDDLAVVAVADPGSSPDWDLAIRRYEVRLNGGYTGSGDVSAALVIDHSAEDPATILGYTPANRLAEFEAIDASDIPPGNAFSSGNLSGAENAWFKPAGQSLVANPDAAWKFRTATGDHAVLRVAEIAMGQPGLVSFKVEYRMEVSGQLGALRSATVTPGSPANPTRISLADGGATNADGCAWDLSIDSGLEVKLNDNGSCQAGSFPLFDDEEFEQVTSAADAPEFAGYLSALSSPIANSVSAVDKPPFLYGIDPANPHRLTPSFNIYLIRRGNSVWKLQFTGYYNPVGGQSGFPTVRLARIR